ncbi:MAG: TraB/GumN family protein [Gammaproteobacteria bacterium]|nr:TraB/GumN family protein [Gammaproteobacteria bacterium]
MSPRRSGTRALALLTSAVLLAAALSPAPAEAARQTLWRVEGGESTLYLLGSLHMLRAEYYPLPAPMEAAFADAEVVVFETDLRALEGVEARAEIITRAVLPAGERLSEQVSPQVRSRLDAYVERSGMPPEALERLKPSMAAITIEVLELARHGLDPGFGVDKHFDSRARAEGKRVVFLESVEFQLGMILDLTPAESEALLSTTLDKVDDGEQALDGLLAAWRSGNTRALEALVIEPMRESPALYARMITDRNARWIETFEALLAGGDDALAVVGAAHLVGEDSVVEMLRRRGYRVVQQ